MEPWIQKTRNGFVMAADEVARVHAKIVQGEQSIAVQSDMKQWAKASGHGWSRHHSHIVDAYAEARGWTQEGFTGMEIVEPFWDWVEDRV